MALNLYSKKKIDENQSHCLMDLLLKIQKLCHLIFKTKPVKLNKKPKNLTGILQ
jgi:hypothetical protein